MKVRDDDVFDIKKASIMINELVVSDSKIEQLESFYNKIQGRRPKRQRQRSTSESTSEQARVEAAKAAAKAAEEEAEKKAAEAEEAKKKATKAAKAAKAVKTANATRAAKAAEEEAKKKAKEAEEAKKKAEEAKKKAEEAEEAKKRKLRGGTDLGGNEKYYYIYCDERLNITGSKKQNDTADKNKKLLTIFPSSFYDPEDASKDSSKHLCVGVVDVVGESKNHVFLAVRGNLNGQDTCIVNVHLESGGQIKEHLFGVMELKRMLKLIMKSNEKWFNDIHNVIMIGDFNLNSNIVTEICYEELKRLKKPDRYCKVMFDRLRTHTSKTDKVMDNEINNYTEFMNKINTIEQKIKENGKKHNKNKFERT